jgi:hypothetical protein
MPNIAYLLKVKYIIVIINIHANTNHIVHKSVVNSFTL